MTVAVGDLAAFKAYLRDVEGLSKSTVRVYSEAIRRYLLAYPTPVAASAVHWLSNFSSDNTRSTLASGLRAYFAWKGQPLKVKVRVGESLPNPLSLGDLWLLLRGVRTRPTLQLQVLTMAFAGLRVTELCELRTGNIVSEVQALRLRGKGKKERIIPLTAPLYLMMVTASVSKRPGSPLFPGQGTNRFVSRYSVEHAVSEAGRAAGITVPVYPHRLRHFYATWRYALTKDGFLVAREMGHSSPATTYGYAGLVQVPAGVHSMADVWDRVMV